MTSQTNQNLFINNSGTTICFLCKTPVQFTLVETLFTPDGSAVALYSGTCPNDGTEYEYMQYMKGNSSNSLTQTLKSVIVNPQSTQTGKQTP